MPANPDLTPVEKDKLTIDPDFDFRNDIAARPFQDLRTNEIGMFKWTGIYHQLQKGFFMLRLRIPGGLITSEQLERIADLAAHYAQGELCITTRQTLQFHWLRKEDLHKVLEGVEEVGLDSKNACGDVSRNVVTCPLQGVCPHEVRDVRPMIRALADDTELRDEQRNLPRKHKMSVNGCGRACGQTLMNCQSWHPVRRTLADGAVAVGWKHYAGGGLGARPYMAKAIFEWVPEDLVVEVTRAATEVYRREGNRRVRAFARLKVVVDRLGPSGFADMILGVLKERGVPGLERIERAADPEADIGPSFLDGQTVIPQRQQGFNTVRVMALRSELRASEARALAGWAREHGDGTLMLTSRQNIQIRFVPDGQVDALLARLRGAGFATEGFERLPDMVACVGTTQCNLAVSDTPNTYRALYEELGRDRAFWEKVGPLRIHMNGCPNSCAQHWIADIGLRGMRKEMPTGSEEGFSICVGGSLGGPGFIAQPLCDVPTGSLVPTVRRLLEIYLEDRRDAGEPFGDFARRVGARTLAARLGVPPAPPEPANERNIRLQGVYDRAITEASPW
jgi:sulfite reductase beta subunit-like hemoprotein